MRPAIRLLASVKSQFLESGSPTGLTGLFTHPTPRGALSYLYNSTLDKLKQIPESSVYRQSTEALIKHRLSIVDSIKPEGYEAWHERVKKQIEEQRGTAGANVDAGTPSYFGNQYFVARRQLGEGEVAEEPEADEIQEPPLEGTRSEEERAKHREKIEREVQSRTSGQMEIEPEPPLSKEQ